MGDSPQARTFRAPGRVNLIGEHTDYNGGLVLPMAVDLACYVTSEPAAGGTLTVHSEDYDLSRSWPVSSLADAQRQGDWTDYVAGVAKEIIATGRPVAPAKLSIRGTLPIGAGLSSSAAIEVATALALLGDTPIEPWDLVRLCHRAETHFVGLPCGIMDQFISVFGEAGSAILLDCHTLEHRRVRLPAGIRLIVTDSGVKHELSQSAYATRVYECRQAESVIGPLRLARIESLKQVNGIGHRRSRHVVTENQRVLDFADACAEGDVIEMGRLMTASHRSLQHDYEVSCEELDLLVETSLAVPGVFGSRMIGGGFGGSTVTLLRPEAAGRYRAAILEAYTAAFGRTPEFHDCEPAAGASEISLRAVPGLVH
jgi:galactokinase